MHPGEALLLPVGRLLRNRRPDETASIANAPELATPNRIPMSSPAFRDGEVVPARYCGQFIGDSVSPPLTWDALPPGTKSLVVVLEGLDAPAPSPSIHTLAAFPAVAGGRPEGAISTNDPRFQFVPSRRGQADYAGPRPLPGHGTHRYRFHPYALDTDIDLSQVPRSGRRADCPRRSCPGPRNAQRHEDDLRSSIEFAAVERPATPGCLGRRAPCPRGTGVPPGNGGFVIIPICSPDGGSRRAAPRPRGSPADPAAG